MDQFDLPEVRAGPGDARPTGLQILQDENRFDGSLNDKVVVVTGCSAGLGIPTVEALVAAGATVYGGARAASMHRAKEALASILNDPETRDRLHLLDVDLTSLASVKTFAEEIKRREQKVNILINNAGVMAVPTREVTQDGFELQLGTNHLAHFYLFQCLKSLLLAGAEGSPDFASRVVNVSSSGHRASTVRFDDINLEGDGSYNPYVAYGNSKTANIWMANHIERLYAGKGVHGYSLMPGGIFTGLQKHVQEQMEAAKQDRASMNFTKSPDQGCATTIWAATARELEGKGGVYCEDCAVAGPVPVDPPNPALALGYAGWAFDQEGEERLWKVSLEMVGLKEDE
ncbi:hypothetical protein M406DRAFT_64022 [Cryphonectria parasitica EP155]|uniref:Short-chain dehydrogenase n=1 Tax=Cryphonectria parasitica (strain ATCC 38755 / EP155) TaxID=660469 RepID=A0A9P4XTF4_CRYP1|nr:uncharacterized protein M406DRAFT_64022 [Cryphonectria parasitica EP155]KAF3760912.1 hypothetical protein M406DRAFT_64022 [Cryphonectria parasitica EP155]